MTFRCFTLFAIFLASAVLGAAQKESKSDQAIRAAIDSMTTAQSAYDGAALDRLFTGDFIEISPVGEFDPRSKVLTFYTPSEKEKAAGVSVDVAEDFRSIRVYGDTAVAIVELTFSMSKDGKAFPPRKMMAKIVCRKERGEWKIASAQYTGIRPSGPAPK
jgi:uncharacterized protein (TIGR02246 family)